MIDSTDGFEPNAIQCCLRCEMKTCRDVEQQSYSPICSLHQPEKWRLIKLA